jgi:hypothetical protein
VQEIVGERRITTVNPATSGALMRGTTARLSLAAAGLAVIGLVGAASAATTAPVGPKSLVVTDPAADSKGLPGDIAKLTYSTIGKTAKVGKKMVYTPSALTIAVETVSSIATDGSVQYDVEGNLAGCGNFYLYASPGSALDPLGSSCADDATVKFDGSSYAVSGKTITFTIPLRSIPGAVAGGVVSALFAYTGSVEPATGEIGPVLIGSSPLDNDEVASDGVYKIG